MWRSPTRVWPVAAVALWSGCAFGPFTAYPAVSPAEYERLCGSSVAPKSLTGAEIKTIWGILAAEDLELADQSAGIEGEFKGWVWCAVCQANRKHPHSCTGTPGPTPTPGDISIEGVLLLALAGVLCMFLIVNATGAFNTTY